MNIKNKLNDRKADGDSVFLFTPRFSPQRLKGSPFLGFNFYENGK